MSRSSGRIRSFITASTVVLLISSVPSPAAASQPATAERLAVRPNPETGSPAFVSVEEGTARSGDAQQAASAFVADHSDVFVLDASRDLRHQRTTRDRLGFSHVRFQQLHRGVPVWGAQLNVHLRRTDQGFVVASTNGRTYPDLSLPSKPVTTAEWAERFAQKRLSKTPSETKSELVVLPWRGRFNLAWHLTMEVPHEIARYEVFVGAIRPEVLLSFDSIPKGHGAATGSGPSVNGVNRSFPTWHHANNLFYLWDTTRPFHHPTQAFSPLFSFEEALVQGVIGTYSMNQSGDPSLLPGTLLSDPDNSWSDPAAVDAHFYAGVTESYYRSNFGRVSIDDARKVPGGMSIISSVHFGVDFCNALWTGDQMVYGDGGDCDGNGSADLKPLSGSLDVVAHELTHGVTQFTSNLIYLDQMGAMNESFSDYFGAAIENNFTGRTDGRLAEDICIPAGGICPAAAGTSLRDMNNGRTMDSYEFIHETVDNGGVHLNSDILNDTLWNIRDAFIASAGTAGRDLADAVAYRTLTFYLFPGAVFADARDAFLQAARDLGATSSQLISITQEFDTHKIGWSFVGAYNPSGFGVALQGGLQIAPAVDGNHIAWVDVLVDNKAHVFNTANGSEITVGEGVVLSVDVSGNRLVWTEVPNPESADPIFRVRTMVLPSGTPQTLVFDPMSPGQPAILPRVDGNVVVWMLFFGPDWDVVWDDLATADPPDFLSGVIGTDELNPVVSRDGATVWAAWEDYRLIDPDIFARSLPSGAPSNRTPTVAAQIRPEISGREIVYLEDADGNLTTELLRHVDASTGAPATIKTTSTDLGGPGPAAIDGTTVVYSNLIDFGGRDYDLFKNNLQGTAESAVSTARGPQLFPSISGSRIVWEDNQNFDADIFSNVAAESTAPTVTAQFPAPSSTVDSTTSVAATFSEQMDARGVNTATFTVLKQGAIDAVPGRVTYDLGTATATFTPYAPLDVGATYVATVSPPARDTRGNELSSPVNWSFAISAPAPPPPPPPPPQPPPLVAGAGYWFVARDGGIFSFGAAGFHGSTGGILLAAPIVGMAATPTGNGYWFVAADGGIFSFGDAGFFGSTGGLKLNSPIVGMAATPTGKGYWFVAADGGIFSFGDARFFGSTGAIKLNQPIVGMAATPTGNGYWFVAADGGIFGFGDAGFLGSTGAIKLNQPIVGMARTPTGKGYWFVAADGGIFSFGDAKFFGSTGSIKLNQPIVGMAATPTGNGYWFVASDGGIFAFGQATFLGSTGGIHLNQPIVGMTRPGF